MSGGELDESLEFLESALRRRQDFLESSQKTEKKMKWKTCFEFRTLEDSLDDTLNSPLRSLDIAINVGRLFEKTREARSFVNRNNRIKVLEKAFI